MVVVSKLIQQGVTQSDIAVLSQYRAQHKELQNALQQHGYTSVAASTVAAAQGMLQLVLLLYHMSYTSSEIFLNNCVKF